ncbi:hypothetical protein [uncultured Anaerovibrio sp.]|uniref:hypothetical protein n=1 Tax=uncultured Anaerovibrio sp. TaxID=361586 RepID=UPI00262458BB|nr:hypothetical protein [uncultured Anaerovibrio sp.]
MKRSKRRVWSLTFLCKEIEDRIYNNRDYDYNLVLENRTRRVAETITEYPLCEQLANDGR